MLLTWRDGREGGHDSELRRPESWSVTKCEAPG